MSIWKKEIRVDFWNINKGKGHYQLLIHRVIIRYLEMKLKLLENQLVNIYYLKKLAIF